LLPRPVVKKEKAAIDSLVEPIDIENLLPMDILELPNNLMDTPL
jgi:hypothetical protein